ncbi:hypothetical protein CPB84DRAFT_1786710 [Gymnopilus junonius]|uniref:Secreted protein n=1 Tax=Gymnopilus junonius TaxID=109634 RepID=A0A9P5TKM8_GYMJU|nr:hypothetical protein CPB84DRAFT_1786710 [Gymnopilus junonius]
MYQPCSLIMLLNVPLCKASLKTYERRNVEVNHGRKHLRFSYALTMCPMAPRPLALPCSPAGESEIGIYAPKTYTQRNRGQEDTHEV